MMVEEAVLEEKKLHPEIKLLLVLPCKNQTKFWNPEQKQKFERFFAQADKAVTLFDTYSAQAMLARNRFLVEHSSVCVCHLVRKSGGTGYTVNYAKQNQLCIVRV